jgi:folylpolyglutamate synthase/dihydropteroate synthase
MIFSKVSALIIVHDRNVVQKLGVNVDYDVQCENACLASAVLKHLGAPTTYMADFYWPCRMEMFSVPVGRSRTKAKIVIDGCHNRHSILMFLQGLRSRFPSCHIKVLFGAGMDKTVDDMLNVLSEHADSVQFIQSAHFRAVPVKDLTSRFRGQDRFRSCALITQAPLDRVPDGTVKKSICEILESLRCSTVTRISPSVTMHNNIKGREF